jgi:hypothetical protein
MADNKKRSETMKMRWFPWPLLALLLCFCAPTWATVPVVTPEISYTATGAATDYAFPFRIFAATDLEVTVSDVVQTLNVDYTVTGIDVPAGGTVVFTTPPADTLAVLISRITPIDRQTDYSTGGPLRAATLNRDLDRIVTQVQDVDRQATANADAAGRAIKFPPGDSAVSVLPDAATRASKMLGFDVAGGVVPVDVVGDLSGYALSYTPLADALARYDSDGVIQGTSIIHKVDTIADLRLITGSPGRSAVQVLGYYAAGDGGGGPVRHWVSGKAVGYYTAVTGVEPDDGGSVIVPTGGDGSAAWLWEWSRPINVRWFGAVGDGITDDGPVIQATLTAGNNNALPIYIPRGKYLITDTLNIYRGQEIRGDRDHIYAYGKLGPFATELVFAPTSEKDLLHIVFDASLDGGTAPDQGYTYGVKISNMLLTGNSTGGGSFSRYGLDANQASTGVFENISIRYFQYGVNCAFTITCKFNKIRIINCVNACVRYGSRTSTTDVWFECYFGSSPWAAIIGGTSVGIQFQNSLFESLSVGAIDIYREASGVQVNNCYSENVPATANVNLNVFRVGVNGATSAVTTALQINGGFFAGYNGGGVYGAFVDLDYAYKVIINGVHVTRFTNYIRTTGNTSGWAVYVAGGARQSVTTFANDITKVHGNYINADLNGAQGPRVRAEVVQANTRVETGYIDLSYLLVANNKIGYGSAAPTSGTHVQGEIVLDSTPSASGFLGWVCTSSGTFSAATDATGDTDGLTAVITGMADTSDFVAGNYITISAGFPAGYITVVSVDGPTQITVSVSSNSAQSNVTVATVDPVFKTFGAISP